MFGNYQLGQSLARSDLRSQWSQFLEGTPVRRGGQPWLYGFRNSTDARSQLALWKAKLAPELLPNSAPLPEALSGGSVGTVYTSIETCVDTSDLIRGLSHQYLDFIGKVDDPLEFSLKDRRIVTVRAGACGVGFEFHPKAVVFAAGESNVQLLTTLCRRAQLLPPRHRARGWHMLVVSGSKATLPALTGCFNRSLFLVSRQRLDDVVWLFSDGKQDRTDSEAARELYFKWKDLVPSCDSHRTRFRWGIYSAPSWELHAMDGGLPSEPQFEDAQFENVTTVWPTKLSFAPAASELLFKRIASLTPYPSRWVRAPEEWLNSLTAPRTSHERWETVLRDWSMFEETYLGGRSKD